MRFIAKIVLAILINTAALLIAGRFIPGISVSHDAQEIFIIALALTALHFFLKPILAMLLGPVILLTLGAGLLFINGFILFILDFFFASLTIQGTLALFWGTLLVSGVNVVYHFSTKS